MKSLRSFVLVSIILVGGVSLQAQTDAVLSFERTTKPLAGLAAVDNYVNSHTLLTLPAGSAEYILGTQADRLILKLPVEDRSVDITLHRFDILTPGALTVAGTDDGDVPFSMQEHFAAYQGDITATDRRLLSFNVSPYQMWGILEVQPGETFVLSSLEMVDGYGLTDFILYRLDDLKVQPDFECGSEAMDVPDEIVQRIEHVKHAAFRAETSDLLVANVAIESDYQAFTVFGGAEAAAAADLALMSTSSALYNRDINVILHVPYLRVWTTPSDPYSDNPASSSTLLNEFRNYWNANMTSIPRTVAHFISPRNQGLGGIAYLNVLCASVSGGSGYGFSDVQSGNAVPIPTYSWPVMVVSHELGHNFGSPHTHNCSWNPPIDTCYVGSETTPCYSGPCAVNTTCIPRTGTVMSYCHLTSGGISLALGFGPLPTALIRSRAEAAGCMTTSSEEIHVGQPNGHEQYETRASGSSPDPTTQITWGTSLVDLVDVLFSSDGGSSWEVVDTAIAATDRRYTWAIPYIPTTTNALVKVRDHSNHSSFDVSDTTFGIRLRLWPIADISPANNAFVNVDSNNYTPIEFIWGSAGTLPGITYKFHFKKKTTATPIATWETGNSGSDTTFSLNAHDIDSVITSWNAWTGDSLLTHWYGVGYFGTDTVRASLRFTLIVRRSPITGTREDAHSGPTEFVLHQNVPNPFNPTTEVSYDLPVDGVVTLRIYNMLGQLVRTLVNERQTAGRRSVVWNSKDEKGIAVSSGIYLYQVEFLGQDRKFRSTRKMVLLK